MSAPNHPFPTTDGLYYTPVGNGAWQPLSASDPRVRVYAANYAVLKPAGQRAHQWALSMHKWRMQRA